MNLTILSIDTINGTRTNNEAREESITKTELEEKRKRLYAELSAAHPEMSADEKKRELAVCFQYRDNSLSPDPLFMPKAECECGIIQPVNHDGKFSCECGKKWYDQNYDIAKWYEKKKK